MPAPINHSVETMLVRTMSALAEEADRAAERRRAFRYDNPEDKPLDTPTMPPVLRKHSLNLVDLYRSIDDGYNDRDLFCDAYQAITAANDALQALRGSQQLRRAAADAAVMLTRDAIDADTLRAHVTEDGGSLPDLLDIDPDITWSDLTLAVLLACGWKPTAKGSIPGMLRLFPEQWRTLETWMRERLTPAAIGKRMVTQFGFKISVGYVAALYGFYGMEVPERAVRPDLSPVKARLAVLRADGLRLIDAHKQVVAEGHEVSYEQSKGLWRALAKG